MTTYTTLVNVDADTAQKLVSFISSKLDNSEQSQQFNQECLQLIETIAIPELVSKILEHNDVILSLDNDEGEYLCFVCTLLS
jgi:hypothetical protein